jgi:mono/diheme cytochrome c family protein
MFVCRLSLPRLFLASLLGFTMGTTPLEAGTKKVSTTHPVVPGFERFFAARPEVGGGMLLLAELNCVSCHKPEASQEMLLLRKQAPILDGVAGRVRVGYLRKFLREPHIVKPGSTMPDLFAGASDQEKSAKIEQLIHFLASTGSLQHQRPERKAADFGRELYHKAGCAVCHGPRNRAGQQEKLFPGAVPLGDLTSKYTIPGLTAFLENPQHTRPSGRMPGLLVAKEAREVAHYLLQGLPYAAPPANLKYAYYEGSFDRLPDFKKLTPLVTGEVSDFDVTLARRPNDFALTFEGYLCIVRDGTYRFYVTSDDGGRLTLDGKTVVDNDGIHAPTTASGKVNLKAGMHKLTAAVFNAGGGVELTVEMEGPGLDRQSVAPLVYLNPEGKRPAPAAPKHDDEDSISVNPLLAEKGRGLFSTIGCASCHTLRLNNKPLSGDLATPLAKVRPEGGCLTPDPVKGVPRYELNSGQRTSLTLAIKALSTQEPKALSTKDTVHRTLVAFNCYACHERDKIGGVTESTNALFTTTQQEMGDEGRVPPPLDGVGGKLTPAWFKKILAEGAHERPYMNVRMPRFGEQNTGHLVAAFAGLDKGKVPPAPVSKFSETPGRIKADGRRMVGGLGMGCIKCHTFAGHKAEGIQAIDMTLMTQRLQRDWFHWYLPDPQKVRPLTRMPSAWPMGQSTLDSVLDGDPGKQIEAIWRYLADGRQAALPVGLGSHFIPLVPDKEAIIYRNFIEGAGSRAIGVGYPEKLNLAFDANNMRLALIWQGAFIDASRHWTDRGAGYQPPLGDNVIRLPDGPAFAELAKITDPWPNKPARDLGFQFRGYRLTADTRPTFVYSYRDLRIEDFPNAVQGKPHPAIVRKLSITGSQAHASLYFRAAAANRIEPAGKGWYVVSDDLRIRIEAGNEPVIRQAGGQKELLVPVRFDNDGRAWIVQELVW